jgi:hypothetical protein
MKKLMFAIFIFAWASCTAGITFSFMSHNYNAATWAISALIWSVLAFQSTRRAMKNDLTKSAINKMNQY